MRPCFLRTGDHSDIVILAFAFCTALAMCFCCGCMEVPNSTPIGPTVGKFAASVQTSLTDRNQKISDLALQCQTKERTAVKPDEVKTFWNEQYHLIVGNSVADMQSTIKSGYDGTKTLDDRIAFWDSVSKGFKP